MLRLQFEPHKKVANVCKKSKLRKPLLWLYSNFTLYCQKVRVFADDGLVYLRKEFVDFRHKITLRILRAGFSPSSLYFYHG